MTQYTLPREVCTEEGITGTTPLVVARSCSGGAHPRGNHHLGIGILIPRGLLLGGCIALKRFPSGELCLTHIHFVRDPLLAGLLLPSGARMG